LGVGRPLPVAGSTDSTSVSAFFFPKITAEVYVGKISDY
jgi:hypothetical protein